MPLSSSLSSLSRRIGPFWLERFRLYILYMSVGIVAIPAGIAYGILAVNGYDRWWTAILSIALGLWLGKMTWKYVDAKLFQRAEATNPASQLVFVNLAVHLDPAAAFSAEEFSALSAMLRARQRALILETANQADLPQADTQISELYAVAQN